MKHLFFRMVGYAQHNICFFLFYCVCLSAGGIVLSDAPQGQMVCLAGRQSGVLQYRRIAPAGYGIALLHDCLSGGSDSGDDGPEQEKLEKAYPFYRRIVSGGNAGIYEVLFAV